MKTACDKVTGLFESTNAEKAAEKVDEGKDNVGDAASKTSQAGKDVAKDAKDGIKKAVGK